MKRLQPIVVGAGPAGSAAAIHLQMAGARAVLIERRAPDEDALCGGFLSWKTVSRLEALGISKGSLDGLEIDSLRLVQRKEECVAPLPAPALALSRRRLDGLLVDRAQELGADLIRDTARFEQGTLTLSRGGNVAWDSLFLATGKHELRGLARPRSVSDTDPMLGLRLCLPADEDRCAGLDRHIEMHLFAGGYAGAVLQEGGRLNLCLATSKARLSLCGGDPFRLLEDVARENPRFAARIGTLPPETRIDAVGRVPYGWRALSTPTGLFRLGDQAGVIPSLAGEGIGIALATARLAAEFWVNGGGRAAPEYQRVMASRLRRPVLLAGLAARFAGSPTGAATLLRLTRWHGLVAAAAAATRI